MTKVLGAILGILLIGLFFQQTGLAQKKDIRVLPALAQVTQKTPLPPSANSLPTQKIIPQKLYNAQTFNNCGPANLAMLFSYAGISSNQKALGEKLRPYQVQGGNNDDKSVSLEELADEATARGLVSYIRPNGTNQLMKQFIASDIPVVTRQWLHENEDIGHYRLIRGYNDNTQEFISDDSFIGPNQRFHYESFNRMWEPFNFEYLIIAPKDKQPVIEKILNDETDVGVAWQHANQRSQDQLTQTPNNTYAQFNLSTSYYYLGQYQKSIDSYEKVAAKLPPRMLWYQIEPVESYAQLKFNNKVLAMTQNILQNDNLAFSELYVLRAEVYLQLGDKQKAADELSKARLYNKNLKIAKTLFDQTKS